MHFPTHFFLFLLVANIPPALGRPRGSLARAVPAGRHAQSNQQSRQVTVPPSSTIANTTASGKRYDTRIWTVVRATRFATSIVTVTITTPPAASTPAALTTVHATTNIPSESTSTPSRRRHEPRTSEDGILGLPSDFSSGNHPPIQRVRRQRRVPRYLGGTRSGIAEVKPPSFGKIPVPLLEGKVAGPGKSNQKRSSFRRPLISSPHLMGRENIAQGGLQAMPNALGKHGVDAKQATRQGLALKPNITSRAGVRAHVAAFPHRRSMQHLSPLKDGTPPQTLRVAFDTGSADFRVMSNFSLPSHLCG